VHRCGGTHVCSYGCLSLCSLVVCIARVVCVFVGHGALCPSRLCQESVRQCGGMESLVCAPHRVHAWKWEQCVFRRARHRVCFRRRWTNKRRGVSGSVSTSVCVCSWNFSSKSTPPRQYAAYTNTPSTALYKAHDTGGRVALCCVSECACVVKHTRTLTHQHCTARTEESQGRPGEWSNNGCDCTRGVPVSAPPSKGGVRGGTS